MKVCWISSYYSPYKLKLFEEISKQVELTAIILGGTDDKHRNSEWNINKQHNYSIYVIDKKYISTINKLAKENDILIDSMYSSIYGILAVNTFRRNKKKIYMHADGGVPIDRGKFVNGILSHLMKRHDSFISSGPHCDEYFHFYGINDNINHYRFSSLTNQDIENNKKIRDTKKSLHEKHNIDNKFTLISVGKPVNGKGFDILLKAYVETGNANDINLIIIGGKPQKEIKDFVDLHKLKNVRFIDLIASNELKEYYASSDAFILCTRSDVWGLVIEEAMSFGLPVITSKNCGAGVHFNMLTKNVYTCDVENYKEYSSVINELYNNKDNLSNINDEILKCVQPYTIENSAADIINILKRL